MAVKKKVSAPKQIKKEELNVAEIEKAHAENAAEVAAREKLTNELSVTVDKKLTKKRLDQVLKNPFVKVKLTDTIIPIEDEPISAVAVRGVMEHRIKGTHLRLLCMINPAEQPDDAQQRAMALRLYETGQFLKNYIISVELVGFEPKKRVVKLPDPLPSRTDKKELKRLDKLGLKEEPIGGTHLTMLVLKHPKKKPNNEQVHEMSKRHNEVGPLLPRYIKVVDKDDEPIDLEQTKKDFGLDKNHHPQEPEPAVTRTKVVQKVMAPPLTDGVPLKKICSDVDIDPKLARRALRSAKIDKPGGRWEWPKDQVEKIKAILIKAKKELESAETEKEIEKVDSHIREQSNRAAAPKKVAS